MQSLLLTLVLIKVMIKVHNFRRKLLVLLDIIRRISTYMNSSNLIFKVVNSRFIMTKGSFKKNVRRNTSSLTYALFIHDRPYLKLLNE